MSALRWLVLCTMVTIALFACAPKQPVDLLIRDANVIDVETGEILTGQTVAVHDGRIEAVVSTQRASSYDATTEVDAGGGFLIPALADAHVHLQYPSELQSYLRNGVGLVVNMSGAPMHLDLRAEVQEGRREGPRIVTAGPTLDGTPPTNPLFTSVTPETAPDIVAWIAAQGNDAVKVYQQMDAETLKAVIEAADAEGLIVSGHVSRSAGIDGALNAGLRYVAHGEELAFEAFDEETRRFDRSRIPALAERMAEREVTVTPMIRYLEDVPQQVIALDDYLGQDALSAVPAGMKLSFGSRQGWFANREDPEGFAEQMTDVAGFVADLTAALQEQGAPLILGTDAGFGGAIPGYSVHLELQSLVNAGLTPLEALQTATLNVGRYLQELDSSRAPWGKVEPGFSADVVLLRENPLEDIAATESIKGVVVAGKWHGSEDLQAIERDLRQRQSTLLPGASAFEQSIIDGDVVAARTAVDSIPSELEGEPLISPDNCIFLGYRYYYRGQRALAGQFYEICAEMHPKSAPLWWHIGQAREEGGDREGAIAAYSRARDSNPWFGQPGEAIERLENPPEAP